MDNVNNWLTLAANLGVVTGIVFLGIEIRQNSALNQVSLYQGIKRDMNDINLMRMENPRLGDIFTKAIASEELSISETGQINAFALYLFNLGDMAFKQYESGLMSERDLMETLAPIGFWTSSISAINDRWISLKNTTAFDDDYYKFVSENIVNS